MYKWYKNIATTRELEQGVLIYDFPYLDLSNVTFEQLTSDYPEDIAVEVKNRDVIVMSQSCDLVSGKINDVTLCSTYPLSKYLDDAKKDQPVYNHNAIEKDIKKKLQRSDYMNMHLLDKTDSSIYGKSRNDFIVVKFDEALMLPYQIVIDIYRSKGRRLQLNPPYREGLAQAFAMFYMRVGNPENYQPL